MSFRDDFNTLNTDLWEIVESLPDKSTVGVVNGKLELKSYQLNYEDGAIDVGIRLKQPLNLYNTQIDIPLELIDSYSELIMHIGLAVTNVPFAWHIGESPIQRGFWVGLMGQGYEDPDLVLQMWEIKADKQRYVYTKKPSTHPEMVRVRIGKKGVYFYEVKDGKEWLASNIYANIDFSNCYLAIYMMASSREAGITSGGRVDYISIVPYEVTETQPNIKLGETVTPPEIPPEVVYPLLGNMIPVFIANALLSLAERFKK